MVLSQFLPKLRHLRTLQNDLNIIIVHYGAKSLGLVKLESLLEQIQVTLARIWKLFYIPKLCGHASCQDLHGAIVKMSRQWMRQGHGLIGKQLGAFKTGVGHSLNTHNFKQSQFSYSMQMGCICQN